MPKTLMELIDEYVEARHRQAHSSYNAETEKARDAVIAALSAGHAALPDEREAFEAWYVGQMRELGFNPKDGYMLGLRKDNHYGEHRAMLNGKWEGWQARAATIHAPYGKDLDGLEKRIQELQNPKHTQATHHPKHTQATHHPKHTQATHLGWNEVDNGKLVATYMLPVSGKVAPALYTRPAKDKSD